LLQKDPFSKALDTKEIQWKEWKYRRLRVWKYRFIYLIKEKEVMIYFSWSMK
jgi:mRNA-degrading endonuclease RelE of RelBE toxin-antitoxin system